MWPRQSECDAFYGSPRGRNGRPSLIWELANITTIVPPFAMTFAGQPVKSIRVHKKVAASLLRVLTAIWVAAGKNQKVVNDWGASIFGGSYNFRLMTGGSSLLMHSWGCAIDLDPARNAYHDTTPNFAKHPEVIKAFAAEGWVWGGKWKNADGMHFQAAGL